MSGFVCHADCKSVAWCLNTGDKWETIITETCGEDEFCNQVNGTCSSEIDFCDDSNEESNFSCMTEGLFPDPFNCHKYYVCYQPQGTQNIVAVSFNCPLGLAFNVKSNKCSSIDGKNECKPLLRCSRPGEMHAWPYNDNIFYMCIKQDNSLYPSLTRCENGYVFRNGVCIKEVGKIMQDAPLIVTTTQRPTICKDSRRYPDPNDCHMYYFCSGPGQKIAHYKCPAGSYYKLNSCVLGKCQ